MVLPIRSAYHRRLLAITDLGCLPAVSPTLVFVEMPARFDQSRSGVCLPRRKSDSLSVLLAVREENCLLAGMGGLSLASRTSSEFRRVQCQVGHIRGSECSGASGGCSLPSGG